MNNEQSNVAPPSDVSPDSLMEDFRGRSLFGVIAFTALVHVVLIGVFSIGYLKTELLGQDTKSMTEEERLDIAEKEAIKAMEEIAKRHNVREQDLSERFSSTRSRPASSANPESTLPQGTPLPKEPGPTEPNAEPESEIERELQKKADGPDRPKLPSLDDEDDLFK